MIAYNNGAFIDDFNLVLPVNSVSVNRGYGAYEFLEVLSGKALFIDRHLARFRRTLALMHLTTDFTAQLESIIAMLILKNQLQNAYIKILALPLQALGSEVPIGLYIFPVSFPPFPELAYTQGMCLLMKEYQRFLPEAKSTDYLASEYYKREMEQIHAVDVLYYSGNFLRETSRGNIFLVIDGVVHTPASNILLGVTRSIVIDLLAKTSHPLKITDVSLDMLSQADEVFITSTTKQVMPVVQINGQVIGNNKPGAISMHTRELFLAYKSSLILPTDAAINGAAG